MNGSMRLGSTAVAIILVLAGIVLIDDPYSTGQFVSNYFAAGDFARGVFAAENPAVSGLHSLTRSVS